MTANLLHLDKIHCIRFVKFPPQQVALNQPFDVVLSITDDVGTPLPGLDALTRSHKLRNSSTIKAESLQSGYMR